MLRLAPTTYAPSCKKSFAVASPIPALAPVMTIIYFLIVENSLPCAAFLYFCMSNFFLEKEWFVLVTSNRRLKV
jgi:hypothetical protein